MTTVATTDLVLKVEGLKVAYGGIQAVKGIDLEVRQGELITLIGAWILAHGIMEIIGAIKLLNEIDNEWLLILSGLLSVAFGALMILNPGAGALAVLWILGAFSVAYRVLLVVLAFKLKKHAGVATPAVA